MHTPDPLLPPWADDAAVTSAGERLAGEISAHLAFTVIRTDTRVQQDAPVLIRETEAVLARTIEGW